MDKWIGFKSILASNVAEKRKFTYRYNSIGNNSIDSSDFRLEFLCVVFDFYTHRETHTVEIFQLEIFIDFPSAISKRINVVKRARKS